MTPGSPSRLDSVTLRPRCGSRTVTVPIGGPGSASIAWSNSPPRSADRCLPTCCRARSAVVASATWYTYRRSPKNTTRSGYPSRGCTVGGAAPASRRPPTPPYGTLRAKRCFSAPYPTRTAASQASAPPGAAAGQRAGRVAPVAPDSCPALLASSAYTLARSALASVRSTRRSLASGAAGTGVPGFGGTAARGAGPNVPPLSAIVELPVANRRGAVNFGTAGVDSRSNRYGWSADSSYTVPCASTLTDLTPFTELASRSPTCPSGTPAITGCCDRASAAGASTAPTSSPKTLGGTRTQLPPYRLVIPFFGLSPAQNDSGARR